MNIYGGVLKGNCLLALALKLDFSSYNMRNSQRETLMFSDKLKINLLLNFRIIDKLHLPWPALRMI